MMKKSVGIGVIGVGMGANLLYINRKPDSRLEVRGLCATNAAKVSQLASEWQIPFWTTDYREYLERDDIQVIGVFSPDHLHAEHALAALNAGKHVICTKPMCTSIEDAAALVQAVERTGLTFLVGQTMRFGEEFAEAKRMVDAGYLGEILFGEAHYVHDARTFFPSTAWRQSAPQDLMYGGASHPIDLLRWYLGDVEEVHAYGRRSRLIPDYPYEDNYLINLRFQNGAIARVLGAYGLVHPPMPMMGLGLYGARGSLLADFTDQQAGHLKVNFDASTAPEEFPAAAVDRVFEPETEGSLGHAGGVLRYLEHFEACLFDGETPSPGVRDGASSVAACAAAWESIRTGKPVQPRQNF
jgi:predicted dehydrogenase